MVGSGFITLQEEKDTVNEECQHLYDLLCSKLGSEYFAMNHQLTLPVGNTSPVALPSNFFKLTSISAGPPGGDVRPLGKWVENEYGSLQSARVRGWTTIYPKYRIVRGQLDFQPANTQQLTVYARYIPAYAYMVSDTDTFDGINGWETWVELSSAISWMTKEESDPSLLMVKLQSVERRIIGLATELDEANLEHIYDGRQDRSDEFDFIVGDWNA
jgi:hypothetical protein